MGSNLHLNEVSEQGSWRSERIAFLFQSLAYQMRLLKLYLEFY